MSTSSGLSTSLNMNTSSNMNPSLSPDTANGDPRELQTEASQWIPEPYLHIGPDRVYNPLTDRTFHNSEEFFADYRALLARQHRVEDLTAPTVEFLRAQGWLVAADADDLDTRFHLKYVSIETHTVCNQKCYFCPVAYDPRKPYFMPTELFDDILAQLSRYKDTIDGVKLINYNEPTLDKRFVDQVRSIKEAGLPPAVLTNGTGLTPKKIDAIVEMGGLRYLSINISTLDREKYTADRGGDHLDLVLRNMEYAKDLPVAPQMEIVVLGTGDDVHKRDYEEICKRFGESRFEAKYYEVMDRAGYLEVGLRPETPHKKLRGCQVVGSRPLQHLHISPYGQCLLCSEDYDHNYEVGHLDDSNIHEILTGPKLAAMRRLVYGLDEAPDDFICRSCVFALTD